MRSLYTLIPAGILVGMMRQSFLLSDFSSNEVPITKLKLRTAVHILRFIVVLQPGKYQVILLGHFRQRNIESI